MGKKKKILKIIITIFFLLLIMRLVLKFGDSSQQKIIWNKTIIEPHNMTFQNLNNLFDKKDKTIDGNIKTVKIPKEKGDKGILYFWVMPLRNRTKDKTHYLLDIGNYRSSISIFVNESNYLVFRITYINGKTYESLLNIDFWNNYEWGFIAVKWDWNEKEIRFYFGIKDKNNLWVTKFSTDNLDFYIHPKISIGSDIDLENQADFLFSGVVFV